MNTNRIKHYILKHLAEKYIKLSPQIRIATEKGLTFNELAKLLKIDEKKIWSIGAGLLQEEEIRVHNDGSYSIRTKGLNSFNSKKYLNKIWEQWQMKFDVISKPILVIIAIVTILFTIFQFFYITIGLYKPFITFVSKKEL